VIVGYDSAGSPIYQTIYGGITAPGNDPKVITVGATKDLQQSFENWTYTGPAGQPYLPQYSTPPQLDSTPNPLRRTDEQVTMFSSRGPTLVDGVIKPDVVAPGSRIITTEAWNMQNMLFSDLPQTVVPLTSSSPLSIPKIYVQYSGTSFS